MFLYHGTDMKNLDSIAINGLRPRKDNEQTQGTWGGMSNSECVYLTSDLVEARSFARRFNTGVIFQVLVENHDNLRIDDNFAFYQLNKNGDSWEDTVKIVTEDKRWEDSLNASKLCAHVGQIAPSNIVFVQEA